MVISKFNYCLKVLFFILSSSQVTYSLQYQDNWYWEKKWEKNLRGSYLQAFNFIGKLMHEAVMTEGWDNGQEQSERAPSLSLSRKHSLCICKQWQSPQSFGFNGPFNLLKSPLWVVFLFVFSLSGVLFLKVLRLICLKFFFLFVYDSFPYCSVRFFFFLFLCGYDCSLKLLLAIVEINALLLISSTRFITSLSIFL